MTEPEPHEFDEDVNDGSMCVCGIPATVHDAWEIRAEAEVARLAVSRRGWIATAQEELERAETAEAQVAKVRALADEWERRHRAGDMAFSMSYAAAKLADALGSVGATEGEADDDHDHEWTRCAACPNDGQPCPCSGDRCPACEPASPAAAEPERCHSCGWLKSNHLANGIVRMAPGVMDEHCAGYLATPAEPTRADEPRACPRPEAHHYQPGTKP